MNDLINLIPCYGEFGNFMTLIVEKFDGSPIRPEELAEALRCYADIVENAESVQPS